MIEMVLFSGGKLSIIFLYVSFLAFVAAALKGEYKKKLDSHIDRNYNKFEKACVGCINDSIWISIRRGAIDYDEAKRLGVRISRFSWYD